jgi:general stress protein 26
VLARAAGTHPAIDVAMSSTLTKLYELIDELEIAMMTTRRADGHLRSRAMATQKAAAGADLWFVARKGSGKLAEIAGDPHVNLAYYKDSNTEWVSVSGLATMTDDRAKIHELYASDWAMWFGKEGDPRHGTPDDPRIVLIGVTVHAAEFLTIDAPRPVLLFELAKGWLTGTEPELGEMHALKQPHRPTSA